MSELRLTDIPDDLLEHLREYALERKRSVNDVVLTAIERELTRSDWQKRLTKHPKTDLGKDTATLLAEARSLRDAELG